jgi:hypothetical protein
VKKWEKANPNAGATKERGIIKGKGINKGKKKNKTKAHPGGSGIAIGVRNNGWPQKRKIGWCVGQC